MPVLRLERRVEDSRMQLDRRAVSELAGRGGVDNRVEGRYF